MDRVGPRLPAAYAAPTRAPAGARAAVGALCLGAFVGCGAAPEEVPDAGSWRVGPPLPGPRLEAAVIGWRDRVWVLGGYDDGLLVVADVWSLDPASAAPAWQPGPPLPAPRTHLNAAVYDDRLYVLGGLAGREMTPAGEAWVLDEPDGAWRALAAMPPGRARGAAAVAGLDDDLVVAGGAVDGAATGDVLAYAPATDTWRELPPLPGPRSHAAAAVDAQGRVRLVGGLEGLDATAATASTLVLENGAWIDGAPLAGARGGCASAVLGGALVCAGGEAGAAALRSVEALDLADGTWTAWPDLPHGRAGTGAAAAGGSLWIVGGARRLAWEPLADVLVLAPGW